MKRIRHLQNELVSEEKISQETLKSSKISNDFLVKYKLVDQPMAYFINSFQTVGWADPYPDDDKFIKGSLDDGDNLKIPERPDDWVYPKERISQEISPFQIYIPKKEIMLKMMRACISRRPENILA